MKREQIIKLAHEANLPACHTTHPKALERFAKLVAEHEQAQQAEPVAYGTWDTMIGWGGRMMMVRLDKGQDGCNVPLYTSPPPRQPLTDEEIGGIGRKHEKFAKNGNEWFDRWTFARAIEAAHGIKA